MAPPPAIYQNDQSYSESCLHETYQELLKKSPHYEVVLSTSSGASDSRSLINEALINRTSDIDHESCDAGEEDSFFVCDLGEVSRSLDLWKQKLPQVQPFYAVKCNTNLEIIKLLASSGCNFDCASKSEIDTVLSLGVSPDRIVYANPCKTNSFIRHSANRQISLTTVDNAQELYKLQKFHPTCGILIRIATDDSTAQCQLSSKFGCSLDAAVNELLPLAHDLSLNVRGVAFHVGSGAKDFTAIHRAVREARQIFDTAISQYGYGESMNVLDIGGGFERSSFHESSFEVNMALREYFPAEYSRKQRVRFIAEPGRFMVSKAFTLATHVIARRDNFKAEADQVPAMLYINDGVYGNLNCILFDHYNPKPFVLCHNNKFFYLDQENEIEIDANANGTHLFSIWGPTCDGLDCVSKQTNFVSDVHVGDWLYFPEVGAYTLAATTSFNGFSGNAEIVYVCSE